MERNTVVRIHCSVNMLDTIGSSCCIQSPNTYRRFECESTTILFVFVGMRFTGIYQCLDAITIAFLGINRERYIDIMLGCRFAALTWPVSSRGCISV